MCSDSDSQFADLKAKLFFFFPEETAELRKKLASDQKNLRSCPNKVYRQIARIDLPTRQTNGSSMLCQSKGTPKMVVCFGLPA